MLVRFVAVAALGMGLAPARAFNPNNPAASGYTLALYDNFQTLNTAVWENNWWYAQPTPCQVAYLPGTAMAGSAGLDLHIKSLDNVAACAGGGQSYSAAHLDTYGNFAQSLGYFEASIKSSGLGGTLTAFWLLPESGAWPPELDIEEIRGDYPNLAYLTNHFGVSNNASQYVFTAPASLGNAYHRYGALVTASTITWYVDGIKRGATKRQAGEVAKMFVVFSLYTGTCGDGWAGCPGQTTHWVADAYVQWVRVWAAPKQAITFAQ
jgi:beta-glucanase (GH16 family)